MMIPHIADALRNGFTLVIEHGSPDIVQCTVHRPVSSRLIGYGEHADATEALIFADLDCMQWNRSIALSSAVTHQAVSPSPAPSGAINRLLRTGVRMRVFSRASHFRAMLCGMPQQSHVPRSWCAPTLPEVLAETPVATDCVYRAAE